MCTMLTTSKNQQRARYYWWTPYSKAVDVSFSSHFSFPCDVMIVKFEAEAKSSLYYMALSWFIKIIFSFPHKFTQFLCFLFKFRFFTSYYSIYCESIGTLFLSNHHWIRHIYTYLTTFMLLKLRDWKIHLCLIHFPFYFYMLGMWPIFF